MPTVPGPRHGLVLLGALLLALLGVLLAAADAQAVTLDDGDILVADSNCCGGGNGAVIRMDPATGDQTVVSAGQSFGGPLGIALAADGTILVADYDCCGGGNGGVIRVDPSQPSTSNQTVVSSGQSFINPWGIAVYRNRAPVVGLTGGAAAFVENGPAVVVDPNAALTDDSVDFGGGALTVDLVANGTADDRLAIEHQGTGVGQIGVSGANVTFGGTTIGTFSGGAGAAPLVVSLNSNASRAAVQALLRAISFETPGEAPATATRTVRVVVDDGRGGTSTSAAVTRQVTVATVNDPPVTSVPGADHARQHAAGLLGRDRQRHHHRRRRGHRRRPDDAQRDQRDARAGRGRDGAAADQRRRQRHRQPDAGRHRRGGERRPRRADLHPGERVCWRRHPDRDDH